MKENNSGNKKLLKPLSASVLSTFLLTDNFFNNIGRQVRERFPGAVVVVNQTVPAGDIVQVRFEEGLGGFMDAIFNKLGRRFEDMDFKASEEALAVMPSGKVYHLPGGFYQLALGEVPKPIAGFIENILSINKIYAVAFVRNKIILGTIILLMRHKDDLSEEDKVELEKYAAECALLLEKLNLKKRILFLDDEEPILDMVKDLLYHEGYDISVARTGKEAVLLYKNRMRAGWKYHAVITDMNLGRGMNGMEAGAEILKLDTNASLIFCTGNIA